jgi:hypothetical protein
VNHTSPFLGKRGARAQRMHMRVGGQRGATSNDAPENEGNLADAGERR